MKNMNYLNVLGGVMTMGLTMKRFTLTAIACGVVQVASAQVAITQVVPMQLPNQQGTELKVIFNGLPVQPKAYQLSEPSRLILDFEGTGHQIAASNVNIASKEIKDVEVQSDNLRSRLVVNLSEHGPFTTRTEGNTFVLKVSSMLAQSLDLASNVSQAQKEHQTGIENIGFQKGSQGEGLINIELLNSQTPIDVKQQGSKIVVRVLGTKVPSHLARRLNVNEFATPVATVDAYNEGSNGVIVIQPSGSYEYMAFQAEDKLTISVKRPLESSSTPSRKVPNYTGKKVSLDFQDIEVRRVLQVLADFTETNIVAADTVQGFITLRLKDVPSDQALDIILKSKNLDKRTSGNVTWVAPVSELIKAEEDEAKALAQSVKLAPIQTDYIQLKYAKVLDIEKLITEAKNQQSSGGGSGQSSSQNDEFSGRLLSPRGSVSIDQRTNTLIVNDTANKIDEIRKMVDLIDVPVKQVMIEARIVRASNSFSKDLGVKWGVMSQGIGSNNHLLVGGSDTTLWDLKEPEVNEFGGFTYDIERPSNLNVDLGVANPAGRIAFGLISLSDFMLDLELSAAEADGHTEIVSTPKVLTADKQKAIIKSGTSIPYQTKESGGSGGETVTTEFIEAVLSLDVTPSITPDGKVSMVLDISKDTPGVPAPNGELTIDKNQIQTNVLVNNGETIVLGGVFENTTGNSVRKVPFLGDLPVVGGLFRTTSKVDNKNELLIFVTPRIVNDNNITNR